MLPRNISFSLALDVKQANQKFCSENQKSNIQIETPIAIFSKIFSQLNVSKNEISESSHKGFHFLHYVLLVATRSLKLTYICRRKLKIKYFPKCDEQQKKIKK